MIGNTIFILAFWVQALGGWWLDVQCISLLYHHGVIYSRRSDNVCPMGVGLEVFLCYEVYSLREVVLGLVCDSSKFGWWWSGDVWFGWVSIASESESFVEQAYQDLIHHKVMSIFNWLASLGLYRVVEVSIILQIRRWVWFYRVALPSDMGGRSSKLLLTYCNWHEGRMLGGIFLRRYV